MVKGKGDLQGKPTVFLGLSFGNLRRFLAEPMDTFIRIDGAEMGLPADIIIFSGETEEKMADLMARGLSPFDPNRRSET